MGSTIGSIPGQIKAAITRKKRVRIAKEQAEKDQLKTLEQTSAALKIQRTWRLKKLDEKTKAARERLRTLAIKTTAKEEEFRTLESKTKAEKARLTTLESKTKQA